MAQSIYHRAALAGAIALSATVALAQPAPRTSGLPLQPPPADAVVGEVVIESPKVVERTRYGVIGQEILMSVRVSYADLDMRTADGAAELDRRVNVAANYVCEQLDRRYPEGAPEVFYCAKNAVSGAKPQVIKARNTQ
jgi:UrcA family protein